MTDRRRPTPECEYYNHARLIAGDLPDGYVPPSASTNPAARTPEGPPVTIDQTGYLRELDMLASAVSPLLLITEAVDVGRLRRMCAEMETIAPFMEPTAYMRGGMTNLADQAAFLAAVDRFVTEVRKLDRCREGADRG